VKVALSTIKQTNKQANQILKTNPQSIALYASTLTITPPMLLSLLDISIIIIYIFSIFDLLVCLFV
jgi:hypothetical protein